jgi:serine/threonine-protein kinase
MPPHSTDGNLLFGVLALQADLLDAPRFAEACAAWAGRKDISLADLLLERGWITARDRDVVEHLLQLKLQKYEGDAHASLAATADPEARRVLANVTDPAIQQSVAGLAQLQGHTLLSTVAYQPEGRGRYTLTHLHASGGIGQVWLAHDSDLGRDVALKELRPERSEQPEIWARFVEEAKITGQLEHPGIVPVYELVRSDNQRAFYTMRFVRGRTLSEAIKAYHQRKAAQEAGPLELRELLGVFVGVCNAVAYAHSRGVIHRDIKGRNVVLGDFGEIMLLDWGLAKVVARAEQEARPMVREGGELRGETIQGQVLGTPAYMSPEQAEGRQDLVDQRSDVYGLGAMLYEILTGQPPFGGTDTQELLQKVIHEAPRRPSTLSVGVPPALEAVCLKALSKRPRERYESVKALADEVRHWLADEPVSAYAEPWTARTRRWMSRHHTLVAASAAAVLVATMSLTAATVLLAEANRETREARDLALHSQKDAEEQRDLADQRAEEARQQRDQAKTNFQLARDAVEEYTTKVANDQRLKEKDLESLRKDLLKSATKFFQKLTEQPGDSPSVRADLGRAQRDLAELARSTGEYKIALAQGEKALALFEQLIAEQPDNARVVRDLGEACTVMAWTHQLLGDAEKPMKLYQRAVRVLEETRNRPDEDATGRKYLANAYIRFGRFLDDYESNPKEIVATFARGVDLLEELAAAFPEEASHATQLGSAYADLGWRYLEIGNPGKGRDYLEKSVATLEGLLKKTPGDPPTLNSLGVTYHMIGLFETEMENRDAAMAAFQKAADIHRRLVAEHPSLSMYQQGLARDLNNLAMKQLVHEDRTQGLAVLEECQQVKEKLAARYPDVPDYQADLARTLQNQSQFLPPPQAAECLERARKIIEEIAAKHPTVPLYQTDRAGNHHLQALAYERAGKWDTAEEEYRQAIRIMTDVTTRYPARLQYRQRLAETHEHLANLHIRRRKLEQAETALRAVLAVREETKARFPDHFGPLVDLSHSLCGLANCQTLRLRPRDALETYQQALHQVQDAVAKAPTNIRALGTLSDVYLFLAAQHRGMRQMDRALESCRQGMQVRQRIIDAYPEATKYRVWLALAEQQLGQLLVQANRHGEATAAYQRVVAQRKKILAAHGEVEQYQFDLANAQATLANHQRSLGQFNEATAAFGEALSVMDKLVKQNPQNVRYTLFHGAIYCDRAMMNNTRGQHAEALADFDHAIPLIEKLAANEKNPLLVANAGNILRMATAGHALALRQLNRFAESLVAYDKALKSATATERTGLRLQRAIVLALSGDHAQAVTEAEAIAGTNAKPAELYDTACVFSMASAEASRDRRLSERERAPLAEQHARRSIELLQRARKAGFFETPRTFGMLKTDTDLEPLRSRDDYRKFVADLEAVRKVTR